MAETAETGLTAEDIVNVNYAQDLRRKLIASMMSDGKLPEDNEDRNLLLKALKDMDSSVYTGAKVRQAKKDGEGIGGIQEAMAQMLMRTDTRVVGRVRSASELVVEHEINPVLGEDQIGVETFSYDQIMSGRFEITDIDPIKR